MSVAYQVIYADPPWRYERKRGQGVAENHYPTMGLEDIKSLPVDKLAAPDCALFLWATLPLLPEALAVMRAWGFTFKTAAFVWVKTNARTGTPICGLGSWTRSSVELCLLGTRGHPKRRERNIRQVIFSPRGEHSKKPDEARRRIGALMGDVPRVELFARNYALGWDVWGNEVFSLDPVLSQLGTRQMEE